MTNDAVAVDEVLRVTERGGWRLAVGAGRRLRKRVLFLGAFRILQSSARRFGRMGRNG